MTFTSKRRRPCALCPRPIRPGDKIHRVGGRHRFAHLGCLEAVLDEVARSARAAAEALPVLAHTLAEVRQNLPVVVVHSPRFEAPSIPAAVVERHRS